jgi:hypothetical protein
MIESRVMAENFILGCGETGSWIVGRLVVGGWWLVVGGWLWRLNGLDVPAAIRQALNIEQMRYSGHY